MNHPDDKTSEAAAAAAPDRRVGGPGTLTPAERERLTRWSHGPVREPAGLSLPELFAAQAARTPDAPAVVCEDGTLSYAELDARANGLAHLLVERGAGPGRFVGILLPRTTHLMVALLAVMKSGAAYVPVDPEYPAERIAYILGDADPALVVTHSDVAAALPALPVLPVLVLDETADRRAAAPPAVTDRLRQPAYAIYTSGSTGRPKGVLVGQAALVNFLTSMAEWFRLEEGDRWAAMASVAFDMAGLDL
ncbi:AMP-binding protein, partial [Streptomyces sp. AA8]